MASSSTNEEVAQAGACSPVSGGVDSKPVVVVAQKRRGRPGLPVKTACRTTPSPPGATAGPGPRPRRVTAEFVQEAESPATISFPLHLLSCPRCTSEEARRDQTQRPSHSVEVRCPPAPAQPLQKPTRKGRSVGVHVTQA